MDSYWEVARKAVPLPNPMVLVPSEISAKEVSSPVRTKFTSKKLLLLVGVFIFVSLMIGILLWILQYEIKKNSGGKFNRIISFTT
ncbi:hypothetical protein HYW54_04960 [Candidatus Gottesmanbacteria bacterium]|nr:hypothetical protein [Candidatus Gottesmanbacteria bacterium]